MLQRTGIDAGVARRLGPRWWHDNALVCGYSRGKLYRTTLVKTEPWLRGRRRGDRLLEHVDRRQLPGARRVDLVVATHSGGPDWGSGPGGQGTLYKISYADTNAPQPVRAWANSPHEVANGLRPAARSGAIRAPEPDVKIEYGPHVRAGDRFESFWPGYSVVELQSRAPRRLLPVLAARLTADRLGLLLSTDRHAQAVSYAVLLPDANRTQVADTDEATTGRSFRTTN